MAITRNLSEIANVVITTTGAALLGAANSAAARTALDTDSVYVSKTFLGPSFRNLIINPEGKIFQRISTFADASNNVARYAGPDRWLLVNTNTSGRFTQNSSVMMIGGKEHYAIRQTANVAIANTAGTSIWGGIMQPIEAGEVYSRLIGNTATLSFWFNSNINGTYSVALRDSTQINSFLSTFTHNGNTTPQKVVINIPQLTTSLAVSRTSADVGLFLSIGSLGNGSANSNLNSWIPGNYLQAAGATNWANTANAFIEVTQVQLEPGGVATPFDVRPLSVEQDLCLRYFERIPLVYVYRSNASGNFAGGLGGFNYAPKRTAIPAIVRTETVGGTVAVTGLSFAVSDRYGIAYFSAAGTESDWTAFAIELSSEIAIVS